MLARQLGDLQGLLGIVHGHHEDARVFGPGNAQQVEAGGVAVEHAVAKGARHLQHVHAVVQHGGGDALGQQHARDDLPVAAEARDDDGRLLGFGDFLGLGLGGLELGVAAQQHAVQQHQQQRADQHGQRHGADEQRGGLCREHAGARRGLEHHKCKLAALGQQQGKDGALLERNLDHLGQGVDDHRLGRQKADQDGSHEAGRAQDHAEVDAHAHGDEE